MRCLFRPCKRILSSTADGLLAVTILALLTHPVHATTLADDAPSVQTDVSLDLPDLSPPATSAGQQTTGKESTLFEDIP